MNPSDLQRALSEVELAELEQLLRENTAGVVPASLDGFLSALGTMPTLMPPNRWFPQIMGDSRAIKNKEAFERLAGLLLQRYNEVLDILAEEKSLWPPTTLGDADVEQWCKGYMRGSHGDSQWMEDEVGLKGLFAIALLAGEFSLIGTKDADGNLIEDDVPHLQKCRESLPTLVQQMYKYWQAKRDAPIEAPDAGQGQ